MKLSARFRVLGTLAAGGMGSVFLALRRTGKDVVPVALKQLHPHLAEDAEAVAMFVDEARIASRIAHPNVVSVHDVEMIEDGVVIVMDYVEGESLSGILRSLRQQGRVLPVPVALRILHDVLLGLHAAHELRDAQGAPYDVVHRDVSPHNILVGVDGSARITDFGVAKAAGRLGATQQDGAVKGKLAYLAPEQIYRLPVDRRTDVFAAGIVLWECLTGETLFAASSEGETLARVLGESIDLPSSRRLEVSLEVDEACLKALERSAPRRYPDAASFAAALASLGLAEPGAVATLVTDTSADALARPRAWLEAARGTRWPEQTTVEAELPAARRRVGASRALAVAALLTAAGAGAAATRFAPPAPSPAPLAVQKPKEAPSAAVVPTLASSAPTVATMLPSQPSPVRDAGLRRAPAAASPPRPRPRGPAPATSAAAQPGTYVPDDL